MVVLNAKFNLVSLINVFWSRPARILLTFICQATRSDAKSSFRELHQPISPNEEAVPRKPEFWGWNWDFHRKCYYHFSKYSCNVSQRLTAKNAHLASHTRRNYNNLVMITIMELELHKIPPKWQNLTKPKMLTKFWTAAGRQNIQGRVFTNVTAQNRSATPFALSSVTYSGENHFQSVSRSVKSQITWNWSQIYFKL
jgi:hypothetical protein